MHIYVHSLSASNMKFFSSVDTTSEIDKAGFEIGKCKFSFLLLYKAIVMP